MPGDMLDLYQASDPMNTNNMLLASNHITLIRVSSQSFPPVIIIRIQTPDWFFVHFQKVLQFLHNLLEVVRGRRLPVITDGDEEHGVGSIAVNRSEPHAILEHVMLEVNEEIKGIGFNHAWGTIQFLFKKLLHGFDLQRVTIIHKWRERDSAVVAWDQNAGKLFERCSGPQDL